MYIQRREINDFGQERSLYTQESKTKQNSIIEVVTNCLHAPDRPPVFLNEPCFSILYLCGRVCVQRSEEDFQELVSCLTQVLGA